MSAANLFDDVCRFVCSNDPATKVGMHWMGFPRAFVREEVLHARRTDAALTIAPVDGALEVRTWAINNVEDINLIDLVAETRMLTDSPDVVDRIATFRHMETIDQVFEVGAFLVQQVHMASMVARFPDLMARVPGLRLWSAEGVAPFWAEGDWDGYRVTFRARHQTATLKVLLPGDSVEALWSASETVVEPDYLSVLSDEEFVMYFLRLAAKLDVAPFPYRFADLATSPRHLDIVGKAIPNSPFIGWGHTPEEGRQRAIDAFRRAYPGQDAEASIALLPSNMDDREFPSRRPAFTVAADSGSVGPS